MIRFAVSLLFVFLLATNSAGLALASDNPNVEDRIRSAVGYIAGQYASTSGVAGFLDGATGLSETQRIYSLDNGFVALALASYQQTHNSEEYYSYLRTAVGFLQSAQTGSRDFYQYYDLANNTWVLGGQLYTWDAYALMGAAYAAYSATNTFPSERPYWTTIENMLKPSVDYWIPRTQTTNGAIVFSFADGSARPDAAANGAILVALVHMALFEYNWGDTTLATKYAQWSQLIAIWLYSLQDRDPTSWGRGGFYTDDSRKLQLTSENGLVMLGLNSYFKAIGVLLQNFQPSLSEMRQRMMNWTESYVEPTMDSWGGPQLGRIALGISPYPKETLGAASLIQALVDVWIDIGWPGYWDDASKLYNWIAGSNELSLDLQQAKNVQGGNGGFNGGIQVGGLMADSNLTTTALTVFAIVRSSYIEVAEFPLPLATIGLLFCLTILVVRKSKFK